MIARYPGNCVVCGGEIVPRETEIEAHPTIVGPRGGKKMAHVSCISKSNPRRPFAKARPHGVPEIVKITVLKAPAGTNEWRTTYDAAVPFSGAGVALQRIINQNSEARAARDVTSAAQSVLDSLIEEGGSTSFELQRAGQTVLVQVQRDDASLAEKGYVIPSVERRAAAAAAQRRQAASARRREYGELRAAGVRRNSGCGCGGYGCWDGDCDCGCGPKSNPRGGEHSQLMALVRQADAGQARKGMAEQEAFAEYEAERAQSRRGRRSR
jgi:hypothetical protein